MFVPTAAAAQAAGFRPCLRCRPESSPELDAWRGSEATVSRALKLIEAGALDRGGVESLAQRLEIGERQLRRLFSRHIGASPITVAQTRRVLLAKQLIHQTNLSMIEIALASGFGSVRRFNETFQRMYNRPPSKLRRRSVASPAPEITILLPYRPPYDWATLIRFLKARAIACLEVVTMNSYSRVIEFGDVVGSIHVMHVPEQSSLQVNLRCPRLDFLPTVIARIRRQFDLGAEPVAIASVLSCDPVLAPLVTARPGLRIPGGWDGFEIAVRAVLGQQITVKAATQLACRIVSILGRRVSEQGGTAGLTQVFPRPERFTLKALLGLGIPRSRATCLAGIANAMIADSRLFEPRRDLAEVVSHLRTLSGIGEWTAQYIAMRALGESDAFLAADVGLQRSLSKRGRRPTAHKLLTHAERWRPWRAYAMLHLWAAELITAEDLTTERTYNALTA